MKSFSSKKLILLSFVVLGGVPLSMLFTNCSESSFQASEMAGDPLLPYAWHFKNTGQKVFAATKGVEGVDLNLLNTWNAGITGKGIKILVSDDGIEDTHPDLAGNYLYGNNSRDYTTALPYTANSSAPKTSEDNHGTAVAGLISAVANNGIGSKGVAFGASVASANFLTDAISSPATQMVINQASGNFDIFNMSWGSTQNALGVPLYVLHTQFRTGALTGRNGKGSVYVKAAGNNWLVKCAGQSTTCLGNAGFDSDNSSPFLILVGALNAEGDVASYSSPGANLWISSFGGEFGDDSPAMVTTDRTGCDQGFATSKTSTTVTFERGANGNTSCNYSVSFNGTSSASPIMAGVVALLLEANPNLTWRDIKYILAVTAKQVYPNLAALTQHPQGLPLPSGAVYEYGWVQNNGGFHFHNWYGFGQVNVDAAVALAKNYQSAFGAFTEVDYTANQRTSLSASIPDDAAAGVTRTMAVSTRLKIESVQLKLNISHADISQLAIELTSPGGTVNYVVNMRNSLTSQHSYLDYELQTNAFYQENSAGTWSIRVIDAVNGQTGTLNSWALRFTGSPY